MTTDSVASASVLHSADMRRLSLLVLVCAVLAHAQVITTVAGTDLVFPPSGLPAVSTLLRTVDSVALDGAGNLYLTDVADSIVAKITAGGVLSVVAGNGHPGFSGDGGPATNASVSQPTGIAVDATGTIYIADTGNQRIRKVSGGTISTVAGSGIAGYSGDGAPALNAGLTQPSGIAVDAAGNLYIADTGNNCIRKVSGGTISTVAGNGNAGFSGDAGPAGTAMLNLPRSVIVDSTGSLYIADTHNHRIRKVSGGTISTAAGNGSVEFSGDNGPATAAALDFPGHGAGLHRQPVCRRHLPSPGSQGHSRHHLDRSWQWGVRFPGRWRSGFQRVSLLPGRCGCGRPRESIHRRHQQRPHSARLGNHHQHIRRRP